MTQEDQRYVDEFLNKLQEHALADIISQLQGGTSFSDATSKHMKFVQGVSPTTYAKCARLCAEEIIKINPVLCDTINEI